MQHIVVDGRVRLTDNLPELTLFRGQHGVVRSIWAVAGTAYEVEFPAADDERVRVLLLVGQLEPAN
jgi:hypothetical protein